MSYIIYKTTNTINGKHYVGVTNGNKPSYLGSGRVLLSAVKEHGRENFMRETLEVFDTEEEAYLREAQIVDDAFVADRNTYNIGKGGKGGPGQSKSEEHKEAIRQAILAKPSKSSGRRPEMDTKLLIETVELLGIKGAAEEFKLTFQQCRDRYYRARKKCPGGGIW